MSHDLLGSDHVIPSQSSVAFSFLQLWGFLSIWFLFSCLIFFFKSTLRMRWVPVLSKTNFSLNTYCSLAGPVLLGVLCRPVLVWTCKFLQAVLGNSRSPAAVLHSGLCRIAGLLGFFLWEIPPRQSAERRPRFPPLPHSLPGEGCLRWRCDASARLKPQTCCVWTIRIRILWSLDHFVAFS